MSLLVSCMTLGSLTDEAFSVMHESFCLIDESLNLMHECFLLIACRRASR
jgi:hypothetical protein